ncbi:MAG: hypothetical protein ACFFED_01760 [Candidatus Thorarchaeota archaeon]
MNKFSNVKIGAERDTSGKPTFRKKWEKDFNIGRTRRDVLDKLLVVCGRVGPEHRKIYETKAKGINADFITEDRNSWVFTLQSIQKHYDPSFHKGILLIGTNKELPGTQISYQGSYAYTDWFMQDVDGDGIPDVPIGRIYGAPETVLYHMDPNVIDSDLAVIFDSQPGRSNRHVEALVQLGFEVEVLERYRTEDKELLGSCEFILQFSDGVFSSRIHGTPEQWASHNAVILSSSQASEIMFKGYPVIFSEACSTAQEGPLLNAFLRQGAAYIGSTLDTLNNIEPFEDWKQCAYADGFKFGFMDLLDSYSQIGQVKLAVDRGITENLPEEVMKEIENIRTGESSVMQSDQALSTLEWVFFGNPLRRTTVGPNADYSPGRLIVDT